MKYSYMSQTGEQGYDSDLTIGGKSIRLYSRESMKRLYPGGDYELLGVCIPGDKSKGGGGDTILLGGKDYELRDPDSLGAGAKILGYVAVGEKSFVAVARNGVPLPIWVVLGLLLLIPLTAIILSATRSKTPETTVLTPDYELSEVDPNAVDTEEEPDPIALLEESGDYGAAGIDIRLGSVTLDPLDASINGMAHFLLTITVEEESYTIFDQDAEVKNGEMPELTLDYTILHVELKQGKYVGNLTVTLPDGSVQEIPVIVKIYSSQGGSMSIGFSDAVKVNLASGAVSMNVSIGDATHDTIVQLIAVSGGQEYLLAESGTLPEGKTLTSMKLLDEAKTLLSPGIYNGVLRLNFFKADAAETNTNTDVQVRITVE